MGSLTWRACRRPQSTFRRDRIQKAHLTANSSRLTYYSIYVELSNASASPFSTDDPCASSTFDALYRVAIWL